MILKPQKTFPSHVKIANDTNFNYENCMIKHVFYTLMYGTG